MKTRVGCVDDHPALLMGLQALLGGTADVEFVGTALTVAELLAEVAPDVVLLDLRLDDGSSPAVNVQALMTAGAKVVVYTEGPNSRQCRQALSAGALAVVSKADPTSVLLDVLRDAALGLTQPTTALAQALETDQCLAPALSEREREALRLYAANLPAKSVARRMGVSEGTVKVYLRRVRSKYQALNRPAATKLDLYRRAVEDGIVAE